ncbi:hypothetical protein L0128_03715 [candidate division KSB1 bacterium]|nr:hypothetical protein [candidate division KSB1 bacterium]
MYQKVTIWVAQGALLLVFAAVCLAQTNQQCLICHSNKTLTKKITLSNGTLETIPLFVDKDKFAASKHGALQCIQCHTDITTANLFSHTGAKSLGKTYGGWARFSDQNDTVTPGSERTRNYYTAASMSCNKGGCHTKMAAFDTSAHHVTARLKNAHVRTVNGESVGGGIPNK